MHQSENIKIKLINIINKDEYSWLILLYASKFSLGLSLTQANNIGVSETAGSSEPWRFAYSIPFFPMARQILFIPDVMYNLPDIFNVNVD